MYEIVCYNSIASFLENVREFDVSDNPYESYAFLSVYFKYHPKGTFYFFDVFEDGTRIAIVPFECVFQSKLFNIKKLQFIGYRQFNYSSFICKEECVGSVFDALIEYLKRQSFHVVINFYDINDNSALYSVIEKASLKKVGFKLYLCPCLHFTDDFDSFFKEVYPSSKKRTELRKFQKRLEELGNFKLLTVDNGDSYLQYEQYINQIFRVHAERFADVYATSFFGSDKWRPYYSELIRSLVFGHKGYLSLVLLDDVVIAFVLCLTNGQVLIDWIPAFDPAFSKYSLGIVQYKMMFEQLCSPSSTYQVFDYSKGSSVYKRKWAKQETANYQYLVNLSPQFIPSCLYYNLEKWKYAFKVYLRDKGVLGKIKHLLGRLGRKNPKNSVTIEINCVDNPMNDNISHFNYQEILHYPVNVREVILTSIYQGYRVLSISDSPNLVSVCLYKGK